MGKNRGSISFRPIHGRQELFSSRRSQIACISLVPSVCLHLNQYCGWDSNGVKEEERSPREGRDCGKTHNASGINFSGFSHSCPCLELFFFLVNCFYLCHRPCVSASAPCSRTQEPRHLSRCPPDSDLCLQHGNRSIVPARGGDGRREMYL